MAAPLLPFVGRNLELESIATALRHPPALIIVEGSAGMGKSRLVAKALATVGGSLSLMGVCAPVDSPPPLGALLDAIRDLRGPTPANLSWAVEALTPLLPELGARGEGSSPNAAAADVDHLRRRAIRALLGAVSPTVCVVEDVQWCHRSTVEALTFICATMPDGLALVVTFRRDALPERSGVPALAARCGPNVRVARVDLGPLDAGDVRALAAATLAPVELAESGIEALRERSAGVPLAVVELLHELASTGLARTLAPEPVRRETVDALAVPPMVRDLELEALAHLPADARCLAEAAAVFAAPTDLDDLAAVCGLPTTRARAAFRSAIHGGLVRETAGGACVMRTPLSGESVLAAIPRAERSALHKAAARRLAAAADPPRAALARHYREAGMVAEWVAAAEAAADEAERACRFDDAARLLAEVARVANLAARVRRRLALNLGHVVTSGGSSPEEAIALIRRCLDEKPPPRERARLRHVLGDLLVRAGAIVEGRRELERAVLEAEPASDLHIHGLATLTSPWGRGGDLEEHMRWLRETELAARDMDTLSTISVRALQCQLLVCAGDRSAWEAVRAIPWRTQAPKAQLDLLWAACALIDPCYHLGRYDRARQFLADAVRRARELGNDDVLAVLGSSTLALDWSAGRWSGLAVRVRASAEAYAGRPQFTVRLRRISGLLAAAAGQPELAERELQRALAEAEEVGTVPGIAASCAGLARLRLAEREPAAACEQALRGLTAVRVKDIWAWSAEVAFPAVEALVACGRRAEAEELVAAMASGLRGRDAPLARAALYACRGHLADGEGRHEEGAREFALAERAYASMPRPHDAAHMAARRGASLLSAGDDEGAGPLYDALRSMRALEATGDVARVRRVLRRFRLPVPSEGRRGRIGYGTALSPRQREIAELAARGLTNAQISARLALSARTVENHLSLAMAKLAVRSRTALARQWAQN